MFVRDTVTSVIITVSLFVSPLKFKRSTILCEKEVVVGNLPQYSDVEWEQLLFLANRY